MTKRFAFTAFFGFYLFSMVSGQSAKVINAYNYLQSKDYNKAQEAINAAIEDERTGVQAKTWMIRGDVYRSVYNQLKTGDSKPEDRQRALVVAVESYAKALALDTRRIDVNAMKDHLKAVSNYAFVEGVAAYNSRDYKAAAYLFQGCIDGKSQLGAVDSLAHFNLALAYEKVGLNDYALEQYQKCLEIGYNKENVYGFMVYLHRVEGRVDEGAEINKKGLEEYPNNPDLLSYYVNYLLSKDDQESASIYLNRLIAKQPANPVLYYTSGTLNDKSGRSKEAETDYLKALEIKPDYFDAQYNLGAHYFNLGVDIINKAQGAEVEDEYDLAKAEADQFFKKALLHLEKAHELDPSHPEVLESLVQIYARSNDVTNYTRVKKKLDIIKQGG